LIVFFITVHNNNVMTKYGKYRVFRLLTALKSVVCVIEMFCFLLLTTETHAISFSYFLHCTNKNRRKLSTAEENGEKTVSDICLTFYFIFDLNKFQVILSNSAKFTIEKEKVKTILGYMKISSDMLLGHTFSIGYIYTMPTVKLHRSNLLFIFNYLSGVWTFIGIIRRRKCN
jgi:hypothetical protein